MQHLVRRSLLVQLLGVYLLFVAAVLGTDVEVNSAVQQQVRTEVQTTDLALAQEVATDTSASLRSARAALTMLSRLPSVRTGNVATMTGVFQAFKAARPDIDLVYWLDAHGTLQLSAPSDYRTLGQDFSRAELFQRAAHASGIVVEDGFVDLTTFNAAVMLEQPVRDRAGRLIGVVAISLPLSDLDEPLQVVIQAQARQGQHLLISIIDAHGLLIGTTESERILQPMLDGPDALPGAAAALAGHVDTQSGTDSQGQQWLYSAVPVVNMGWAVVVQRPTDEVLAAVTYFRHWILIAALLFALGGLLFWFVLLRRVVRPLHVLATRYATLPTLDVDQPVPPAMPTRARRADEIGGLERSLSRLEHDVMVQLTELHTLLDTSTAVVSSLDPRAVGGIIIREARRLVDVQAAAVLVPDEDGVLRVLVSTGRDEHYDRSVRIEPDDYTLPAALALRDRRAVQFIAGEETPFPPISYAEGFRAVLAIPIISRHVGGVVLLVHRAQPQRFTAHEVELLLTFANYATLAWEHAVLYERSDERLREVARENERLYRDAMAEKQTLAAIMRSMSDGLILTDVAGLVLYANPGASAMTDLPLDKLNGSHVETIYSALRTLSSDPANYDLLFNRVRNGELSNWFLETELDGEYRAIRLRLFDVQNDVGEAIGRGLLLRDVTREHELDQFKTTLLAAVGHELRTPLAAIKGYASTLLQDDVAWSSDDQRYFLQTISNESDLLAQLVSSLLDLSRSEAGLLLLRRAPHRLRELVSSALRRLFAPVPHLVVDIPTDLPLLDVDGARIEVVLHNLLANAVAYGNGHVGISAERRDGSIVVHVSDDGPGIAADELRHIFERFYRASRGHQQRSGGTGLGLAICKAFVEAHGGTIWAESNESGTMISFTVPAISPPTIDTVDGATQADAAGHDGMMAGV